MRLYTSHMNQIDRRDIAPTSAHEELVPDAISTVDELTRERERLRRQVAALRKRTRAVHRMRPATEGQLVAALNELERVRRQYRAILDSTLWQTLHPVRRLGSRLPPSVRRLSRRALKLGWWTLSLQLLSKFREPRVASEELASLDDIDGYGAWVELYDTITDDDRIAMNAEIGNMAMRPLISVVMPVYETPEPYLRAAIESVRAQRYPNWELCIADDASP
jgi:hypothetical protein